MLDSNNSIYANKYNKTDGATIYRRVFKECPRFYVTDQISIASNCTLVDRNEYLGPLMYEKGKIFIKIFSVARQITLDYFTVSIDLRRCLILILIKLLTLLLLMDIKSFIFSL